MFEQDTQIREETVTLLLCNAVNRNHSIDVRAHRIRRLAQIMVKRNKDKSFKNALKAICNEIYDGQVVLAIEIAESQYWSRK